MGEIFKITAEKGYRHFFYGSKQETLDLLEEMKHLAVLMRYEMEQGNVDEFAKLLNQHWEV